MTDPVEVLVVDDHAMVAEGLRLAASLREGLEVVGVAETIAAALDLAERLRPDVVVLDEGLPDGEGAEAVGDLKSITGGRVLIVTGFLSDQALFRAVEAGVDGVVSKGRSLDDILDAVERVARGESVFAPETLAKLMRRSGSASSLDRTALTARELDVLALLATGVSTEAIASSLHLSTHTVRNHISRILMKLGAATRLEAVVMGIRAQLVAPPRA